MKLPDNSVGISDIMDYRECAARFVLSMRRHMPMPPHLQIEPGETDDAPERTNWTNAYGSAIHEAVHLVQSGHLSHEKAIEGALLKYGTYLDPDDIAMLRDDLNTFERRRPLGVTLVGSEMELRVPLFVHPTEGQVYFRFRLDVLYRLNSNPSVFLHRDLKSSKWQKSGEEVHKDPQMWAYNWAIHEYLPECGTLLQTYDQLRFGELRTTKNDQQRADMKRWLIDMVNIIIADETYKPKLNDFCRFCPLVLTCREPRRAVADTRGMLALLAPLTKDGRRIAVEFNEEAKALEDLIVEDLPKMVETRKHIKHVEDALKDALERMPTEKREELGWRLKDRKRRSISPDGLRELHAAMGDTFYQLVNLPITRLEELVGKPEKGQPLPRELEIARNWTTEDIDGVQVVAANSRN